MEPKKLPPIALGTWSWGVDAVGGDQVLGKHLGEVELKPVFYAATMEHGLNLWDSAVVYGMGASEDILGTFAKIYPHKQMTLSTKFAPKIAENTADPVADASKTTALTLTSEEVAQLERLAADRSVDTRDSWQALMV